MGFKLGVDVGGTFTDFLVMDDSGASKIYKAPTTPRDPTEGFFDGLWRIARDHNLPLLASFLEQVSIIVHGTTITTNAVLTGEGARTSFVTTKGFRDVLNMRRGLKERQYEKYEAPRPFVPRHRIYTVEERVDVEGRELVPLNEDDVLSAARAMAADGTEAVGVSLLWSFLNPAHEKVIGEMLARELPEAYVSLSVEVLPQIRVYERNSTTALNAYVGPPLSRYLAALQQRLADDGFRGALLIMQSNGGVMAPEVARRYAVNTLLSGPAGGPVAGIFYGRTIAINNVISIDMGGTSFDVSLVRDGQPVITTEGSVGGYRIAAPTLDIHTIGAGGGSISWIDTGGLLQVGPKSAGALPGPVCYGRGGTEPTVTDADLILGYLEAESFFGGELKLDLAAAKQAIKTRVADPLGLDIVEAANGIYRVVNSNMAAAISVVSVQRGHDPREFVLVVEGGAGPIHAAMIAKELGIPMILVPRDSSVFCAAGMLISDLKHDYVRTYTVEESQISYQRVNDLYLEMAREATTTLKAEGIPQERISLNFSADLRYIGQFNEVQVPSFAGRVVSSAHVEEMVAAFHKRHDDLYGYSMPGAPVELINLRLTATGAVDKPQMAPRPYGGEDASAALKGRRAVYFDGKLMDVPVYDGLKMQHGNVIAGPAIIGQPTTTIVVTPDYDLVCSEYGDYLMHPKGTQVFEILDELKVGK